MKALKTLVSLLAGLISLFMGGCATAGGPVQTGFIPTRVPIPQEQVVIKTQNSQESSVPSLNGWQKKNHTRFVGDLHPKIEDGMVLGWNLSYIPAAEEPNLVWVKYAKQETPFIIPTGLSEKEVLKDVWVKMKPALNGLDPEPIALNAVSKNDQTIVYGIWYTVKDPNSHWDAEKKREVGRYPGGDLTPAARWAEVTRKEAPLPQFAIDDPKLQVYNALNIGPTVEMAPFKVEETRTMINFSGKPDKDGKVAAAKITGVTPDKAFAQAGVKEGMILVSVNGVQINGMPIEEFAAREYCMPPAGEDFRMEVMDSPGAAPHEIVIARQKLMRRIQTTNSVASTGTQ